MGVRERDKEKLKKKSQSRPWPWGERRGPEGIKRVERERDGSLLAPDGNRPHQVRKRGEREKGTKKKE